MQSKIILERVVRSLTAVVGRGKTILKALKAVPIIKIYPSVSDRQSRETILLITGIATKPSAIVKEGAN